MTARRFPSEAFVIHLALGRPLSLSLSAAIRPQEPKLTQTHTSSRSPKDERDLKEIYISSWLIPITCISKRNYVGICRWPVFTHQRARARSWNRMAIENRLPGDTLGVFTTKKHGKLISRARAYVFELAFTITTNRMPKNFLWFIRQHPAIPNRCSSKKSNRRAFNQLKSVN